MDLKILKEAMPFKWRVQSTTTYGAQCVAYVDSRQVQDKLDEVVGPENWQSDYKVINDNLYGGVGIRRDNGEWVWKWDCGTESNTEKEKGEASDSFKRAAVKWGIGRFLYAMPLQQVKIKKHTNNKTYPVNDSGEILWDSDSLTNYINTKIGKVPSGPSISSEPSRPRSEKYSKPTEEPTYVTPDKPNWSTKVKDKASKISKDEYKGSQALLMYLPDFNAKNNTQYRSISELNTDEKLLELITFVENLQPDGLE